MLLDEIREIGEIIAPKLYGKFYHQLAFAEDMGGMAKSELFHVCAMAQTIRLEAMKAAAWRYGNKKITYGWPEILEICHEVIERPGAIEKQKAELRLKGYLQ